MITRYIRFLVLFATLGLGLSVYSSEKTTAAVDTDYQLDKSKLLQELARCRTMSYPKRESCAEEVSEQLMALGRHGDTSVLQALFGVSNLADGALAESLGVFFAEELTKHPQQFLTALKHYPTKQQQNICRLAGLEDGSGMSRDTYFNVLNHLTAVERKQKPALAHAARTCRITITRTNIPRR